MSAAEPTAAPQARYWRQRAVPLRLHGAVYRSPLVEIRNDVGLFRMPGVGRFLTRADGRTSVEMALRATAEDVECFVSTSVAALGFLLRGSFPLHGCAIGVRGAAVAIIGPAGVGKSTLVAGIAGRGHALLADGVLVVDGSPPLVHPTAGEVALWPDAAAAAGLEGSAGRRIRPGVDKCLWSLPAATEAMRLGAVVVVTEDGRIDPAADVVPEPLTGAERFTHLVGSEWFPRAVGPLGRSMEHFEHWTATAPSVDMYRLSRGRTSPGEFLRSAVAVVEGLVP